MRFHIVTIFPEMFGAVLCTSMVKRARESGLIDVSLYDLRDFTSDRHRSTDDTPYGGGEGMVMKVEPIAACLEEIAVASPRARRLLLAPGGTLLSQALAWELARESDLVLVCGRYEGVDARVSSLVDEEISIGDYVLSGGELPAMVILESVTRLLPGALGNESSALRESFTGGLLEYPQYTRPEEFRGLRVPAVLLSGNHEEIERWRRREAIRTTARRRPDLFARFKPAGEDCKIVADLKAEGQL